ncbi:M1 family metallopeptidase [Flavobacterium macrobrachii]|jgi:aminopeptidase N|uniref:M1 family metallopeptidase n=1 Tax=Flavobacterium macrobrachii TaxID=591204 RepID=UPI0037C08E65
MRVLFFLFLSFFSFAQQTSKVDFKTAKGNISVDVNQKKVFGTVNYVFEVKESIDTIKIDAQKMTFSDVKINKKSVKYSNSGKTLNLFEGFKKGKNTLTFYYEAFPKQTMYFVDKRQVWTQGQGKYTSHWFPSFDDVNEKVIFNMTVSFDENYNVIANGFLKKVVSHKVTNGAYKVWYYEMKKPMSSYLLALVIGDFYNKIIASKSGIPLQFFIQPKDTAKFEPTYRHSKQIFDYLEKEIGYNYPWKLYKQVPVEDFLYAGMENTTCTIFAQDFVVDEIGFNDRNYINVNAHELAHQWFGDLVTAKSGKHHWLQEGFATYYALLAEKEIFGDDYFNHQLYRNSLQLRNAAKTDTIPVMNEKASSLSFYQKGAWALHFMREKIGAKLFQKAVQNYLKKYQFKNVETSDFLAEVKKVAPNFDTLAFQKMWLEDYHFPTDVANEILRKSSFMQTLFDVQQLRKKSFAENKDTFAELLKSDLFYPIKTEIIYQLKDVNFADKKELLELAMQTNDIKVLQSVAEFMDEIPLEFKAKYETFLDDKSYETIEIALIKLFNAFPESQAIYLEKAKNWYGNNDLGLRTTFLLLSQMTDTFDENQKQNYFSELVDYTSSNYESSVRQNAFNAAFQAKQPIDDVVLKNLVNATSHHKWQMTKFARDYIRNLLKTPLYREKFENLLSDLPENDKNQLQKLLNEK